MNTNQLPTPTSIFRQDSSNISLYSLEGVNSCNWEIFMWLASLDKIENFIYLFILVWDATPLQNNNPQEFSGETEYMVRLIGELTSLKALENDQKEIFINTLNDYRHCRLNNKSGLRNTLVQSVQINLESCGLKQYTAFVNQLQRLNEQKIFLRRMIFSRVNSFCLIAKKVHTKGDQEKKLLIKENENLKNQAETLVKENSQQQVALGNLTNVSWGDEDPNSTIKLVSYIEELQDKLSDFTMVQGNDYKIIDGSARFLLNENKCQVKYPSPEAELAIGSLLQSYAIKLILGRVQNYLKKFRSVGNEPNDKVIDSDIVNTTEHLIRCMEFFKNCRKGEDEITKIAPIKIRQHAYSALSCRGFPDEHPLIQEIVNSLLEEMNRFREVVDKETRDELHCQAIQITRGVIDLFYFRLKTQAFEPTYYFFETGQDVDIRLMQGAFGREEAKKLEVETCGFPVIGIFGDSKQKVFTKAQIIARPKGCNNGDLVNSMKNLYTGPIAGNNK